MFNSLEHGFKKTDHTLSESEQIKKIQEDEIHHLDEQIKAKQALKDLIEKNLQKAKEL